MGTHKVDLRKILYNLTDKEGKEEQEHEVSLFPVMVRSTAHKKGKRKTELVTVQGQNIGRGEKTS